MDLYIGVYVCNIYIDTFHLCFHSLMPSIIHAQSFMRLFFLSFIHLFVCVVVCLFSN